MLDHTSELVRCRGLAIAWVARESRARRRRTALEVAWAVIRSLALSLLLILGFGVLVRIPSSAGLPFPLFACAGALDWTFTATSVTLGVSGAAARLESRPL